MKDAELGKGKGELFKLRTSHSGKSCSRGSRVCLFGSAKTGSSRSQCFLGLFVAMTLPVCIKAAVQQGEPACSTAGVGTDLVKSIEEKWGGGIGEGRGGEEVGRRGMKDVWGPLPGHCYTATLFKPAKRVNRCCGDL